MKITSVEVFVITADWTQVINRLNPVFVRINTNEGINGPASDGRLNHYLLFSTNRTFMTQIKR